MRVFHTTRSADQIIKSGFRDGEDTYGTMSVYRGVWVADQPVDSNEGARGEDVLMLDVPEEVLRQHEWEEDWRKWREFLVPANVLNRYPVLARGRVGDEPESFVQLGAAT